MLSESYSSPLTLPPGTSTPVGPAEGRATALSLSDYLLTYSYLSFGSKEFLDHRDQDCDDLLAPDRDLTRGMMNPVAAGAPEGLSCRAQRARPSFRKS